MHSPLLGLSEVRSFTSAPRLHVNDQAAPDPEQVDVVGGHVPFGLPSTSQVIEAGLLPAVTENAAEVVV